MSDFDAAKDAANIAKHGVSRSKAFEMDTDRLITLEDRRFAYEEDRWISIGPIDNDLFVLAPHVQGSSHKADQPSQGRAVGAKTLPGGLGLSAQGK